MSDREPRKAPRVTPFPILEPPFPGASPNGDAGKREQAQPGPAMPPKVPRAALVPGPFAAQTLAAAAARLSEMSAEISTLKPWQKARRAALAGQLLEISNFLAELVSGPGPDTTGGTP